MTYKAKMVREHKSDCAVHNRPYTEAGPCDCGAGRFNVSLKCGCNCHLDPTGAEQEGCECCDHRTESDLVPISLVVERLESLLQTHGGLYPHQYNVAIKEAIAEVKRLYRNT